MVVTIIAILAGLLTISIQRSRLAARTMACLSNLRQLSIALQTYVNDNEGRMPALQNRDSITNAIPSLDTVLIPSEKKSRVFQCPSDRSSLFAETGTSYFWNFTVNGQDVMGLFSIVGGTNPARIPLISDKEGFHPELKDKVNVLYADGCVSKELKFSTSLP
jgi:type II secretory pathway pseudopilin PulG